MVELTTVQSCDGKVLTDKTLKVIELVQSKREIIVAGITNNAKPNQSAYSGGAPMESFLNSLGLGEKFLLYTIQSNWKKSSKVRR
jgi:hypothetical protein